MFVHQAIPPTVINSTEASNKAHKLSQMIDGFFHKPKLNHSQFRMLEAAKHSLKQAHIATNRIPILTSLHPNVEAASV
jgi:pyruvate-formate lyase